MNITRAAILVIAVGLFAPEAFSQSQPNPDNPPPPPQSPPPTPVARGQRGGLASQFEEMLASVFNLGVGAGHRIGLLDEKTKELQAEVDYWRAWCGPRPGCSSEAPK